MMKLEMAGAQYPTETLDRATQEADRLLSTFNALLRIARIESDTRKEGFVDLDLASLVQDVAELYEPLAEEKGQHFDLHLGARPRVHADRDLLFQAIANLLDNAIKYTPPQGHLRVDVGKRANLPFVVIADSGPGIPVAAQEKVFQRFFRLEDSRTTPGNGLGLSLVAAVAKLHRIRISLDDNAPGLCATLEFSADATPN
jgi:signal transduction histidine kinase